MKLLEVPICIYHFDTMYPTRYGQTMRDAPFLPIYIIATDKSLTSDIHQQDTPSAASEAQHHRLRRQGVLPRRHPAALRPLGESVSPTPPLPPPRPSVRPVKAGWLSSASLTDRARTRNSETWRYTGTFSRWNRFKGAFPGLGIATVAFVAYLGYEQLFLKEDHHGDAHGEGHH